MINYITCHACRPTETEEEMFYGSKLDLGGVGKDWEALLSIGFDKTLIYCKTDSEGSWL
jgi:hypothetical protein